MGESTSEVPTPASQRQPCSWCVALSRRHHGGRRRPRVPREGRRVDGRRLQDGPGDRRSPGRLRPPDRCVREGHRGSDKPAREGRDPRRVAVLSKHAVLRCGGDRDRLRGGPDHRAWRSGSTSGWSRPPGLAIRIDFGVVPTTGPGDQDRPRGGPDPRHSDRNRASGGLDHPALTRSADSVLAAGLERDPPPLRPCPSQRATATRRAARAARGSRDRPPDLPPLRCGRGP
jgi:hypothetical protein